MREVTISRPVTVSLLAEALETKAFVLLAALIKRQVFIAPSQTVSDALAIELAAEHEVRLRIRDDGPPGPPLSEDPSPPDDPAESPDPGALPLAAHRQALSFPSYLDPDTLSPDDDSASGSSQTGS